MVVCVRAFLVEHMEEKLRKNYSSFIYTSTYCRPVHELGAFSPYLGSTSRLILHAHAYFEREKQHKASMKIHNCKIIMHFLPLLE